MGKNTQLYKLKEIQDFIANKGTFKELVKTTKETDFFYLEKRSIESKYNPHEKYNFDSWKHYFTNEVFKYQDEEEIIKKLYGLT